LYDKDAVTDVVNVVEKKLSEVNKKVAVLSLAVLNLQKELRELDYELSGVAIYLNDIKDI
tara:strand:+ start:396 stop:575 length:180 start_codon:yes stop_codon:yes gene_type:complete